MVYLGLPCRARELCCNQYYDIHLPAHLFTEVTRFVGFCLCCRWFQQFEQYIEAEGPDAESARPGKIQNHDLLEGGDKLERDTDFPADPDWKHDLKRSMCGSSLICPWHKIEGVYGALIRGCSRFSVHADQRIATLQYHQRFGSGCTSLLVVAHASHDTVLSRGLTIQSLIPLSRSISVWTSGTPS